jgi:hypothetical protein
MIAVSTAMIVVMCRNRERLTQMGQKPGPGDWVAAGLFLVAALAGVVLRLF